MLKYLLERVPLAFIFIAYAGGIVASHFCSVDFLIWFVTLLVIFVLELLLPDRFKSIITVCLLLFFLGGMNHSRRTEISPPHLNQVKVDSEADSIKGMVLQSEKRSNGSLKLILKHVEVKEDLWVHYKGKFLLTIKQPERNFIHGDLITFSAKIYKPRGKRNPGEFDYEKYLHNHGVYALGYLDKGQQPHIYGTSGFFVRRAANIVKIKIQDLIDQSVSGQQNAILKALIVGVRGEISDEVQQAFVDSGVIHVLAVSGLHVGYVTLVFLVIFGFLRLPRKVQVSLTIVALWFYAIMVDLKPSVTRAVIMASLVLIGQAWERRGNIYNTLSAAALIQTFINPVQIFDIGFQLSFVAVFSIIYIYKRLEHFLPVKLTPSFIENTLLKRVVQLFLVSASALLGTLPITVYYFHRIPLISVLANIVVVPLIGLVGALGFAQVILGFIWSGINIAYGEVQMVLIGALRLLVNITSKIPFANITVAEISVSSLIIWYAILFGILNFDKKSVRRLTIYGILILMNLWIWGNVLRKPELHVTFFDVGQGDAALVEFPGGKKMIVDTGDHTFYRDYGKLVIAPYLERKCIDYIDILALSHPHNDHIGGAPYLLRNVSFGEIWETDLPARSKSYYAIRHIADSLQIPIKKLYSGDFFVIDCLTKIYVIHPSRSFIERKPKGYNDYSTVFKLNHGEVDFLFTGDIEELAEDYVALWGNFINSEVLKVPHHGSITSSSFPFLGYVNPKYSVISVGERNKFNHPSLVTIAKYDSLDVETFRTDKNGAVVMVSDGKKIHIRSF